LNFVEFIIQEAPTTFAPSSGTMSEEEKMESQPSSGSDRSTAPSLKERISNHLSNKVETAAGYAPLLVCCFATGLTDGTVYNGTSIHQSI
jgi:hypothetical protein